MNTQTASYSLSLPHHIIEERQDVIFRKVRGILNKITPETFDKLSKELINVGLDSPRTLRGVIYLLFDKALKDLKYSSLYAKLCQELSEKAPNFEKEPGPNTFCKILISKCEDEFERRRKATEDFDSKNELNDEEYEQRAIAKQKMLGNIKFICELGKKRLLQEEILHECIRGLLSKKKERPIHDQAQDLECLCQIMRTIGNLLDIQTSRNLMNQYFDRIDMFSKKAELPSRIRFMLRDVIDLRNNNWRPRPFQREDNVPQPLSKLRVEAGYDPKANSTMDKFGNSRSLIGISDLSKLNANKLSLLLDDEPSFTTSSDFHWGPTFLPLEQSFDPFSMNVTGHKQNTNTSVPAPKIDPSITSPIVHRSQSNQYELSSESSTLKSDKQSSTNSYIVRRPQEPKRFVESTAFERRPFSEANPIIAREERESPASIPKGRAPNINPPRMQRDELPTNISRKFIDHRSPPQIIRGSNVHAVAGPPGRRHVTDSGPTPLQAPPNLPSQQDHKFDPRNTHIDGFESRDRRFQRPNFENDHRHPKFSNNSGFKPARNERPANREHFSFDRNSHLESDLNLNWRVGPGPHLNNNTVGHPVPMVQRPLNARATNHMTEPLRVDKPVKYHFKPIKQIANQIPQVRKLNEGPEERRPILEVTHNERIDKDIPNVSNHRGNLLEPINYRAGRTENIGHGKFISEKQTPQSASHSPARSINPIRPPPQEASLMSVNHPNQHPIISNHRYNPPRSIHLENIERREPRRFNHSNHHSDLEHPSRFSDNGIVQQDRGSRPIVNKNHHIEPPHVLESENIHSWRKIPFVAPNSAANKELLVDKQTPVLPKPTRIVDTNFSLRPSHNLIGRTKNIVPSISTKKEAKQESSTGAQSKEDSLAEDNSKANVKPTDRFQPETVPTLPHPAVSPPMRPGAENPTDDETKADGSPTKASAKDFHLGKFLSVITDSSNELSTNSNRVAAKIRELKIPKNYQKDCLVCTLKQSISKSESDRDNMSKLFVQLVPSIFEATSLIEAFKVIFEQLQALEVETPRVKSLVACLLSQAILDGLLPLEEVGSILTGGKHHPLFLLCLQKLDKSAGQAWLSEKFVASKINLMDMLPESDQSKDRLASVLKDRCLGFLDPMLTIEPDLWEQLSERDPSPAAMYRWVKDNVGQPIQKTPTFAHVLIYCLLRYIHNTASERTKSQNNQKDNNSDMPALSDKSSPVSPSTQSQSDVEKELLTKYQQVLQAILTDKQMQLATLYALQSFYHGLEFPKGSLLRWFHMLYDMNIVDEDVFFKWKEEINDKVPGKGQALFQVNTWLNWLAEAESEDEEDDV